MRSSGGVSIVEGRFAEPRGAARFAAGGPIASLIFTAALVAAGLLVPAGVLGVGLLVPAILNGAMLGVNLYSRRADRRLRALPLRGLGEGGEPGRGRPSRDRLESRRDRCRASLSLLVFETNKLYGLLAIVMLISFTAQHHIVARRDGS